MYNSLHTTPSPTNAWQPMPMQSVAIMEDKDLVYTILADVKRVCSEYTTAVTESNCQAVRQMFTNLLQDSLQIQAELYYFMYQMGWYNTSSSAPRSDLEKQVQQYRQFERETKQWMMQNTGQRASGSGAPASTTSYMTSSTRQGVPPAEQTYSSSPTYSSYQ